MDKVTLFQVFIVCCCVRFLRGLKFVIKKKQNGLTGGISFFFVQDNIAVINEKYKKMEKLNVNCSYEKSHCLKPLLFESKYIFKDRCLIKFFNSLNTMNIKTYISLLRVKIKIKFVWDIYIHSPSVNKTISLFSTLFQNQ